MVEQNGKSILPNNCININVGVLGHVDSGKTSLSKILTEITSTASLDKHPQSQERGITIDLGFSCFYQEIPKNLQFEDKQYFQYTLVDCPGHGSLIKTIIAGASIIDMMILVIDINKGIQAQTAECLVIREILNKQMIVILNKIDMLEELKREEIIKKRIENLHKNLSKTCKDIQYVAISCKNNLNIDKLLQTLKDNTQIPQRIDHSFFIKGQGMVCTGTVVQGQTKVGNEIYFPQYDISKQIKSIQMFKKPIKIAQQGDRCGIMIAKLQEKPERGIICETNQFKSVTYIVLEINKIKYFKGQIKSKTKLHFTTNHQTILGQIMIFSENTEFQDMQLIVKNKNNNQQQLQQNNIQQTNGNQQNNFDINKDYIYQTEYIENKNLKQYMLITFDQPILVNYDSLIIGAKLDQNLENKACRLVLYNKPKQIINHPNQIKMYSIKQKVGKVDKIVDNYTLMVSKLFSKESNIQLFINKQVTVNDKTGKVITSFGKSGKVKVGMNDQVDESFVEKEVILKYKKKLFYI